MQGRVTEEQRGDRMAARMVQGHAHGRVLELPREQPVGESAEEEVQDRGRAAGAQREGERGVQDAVEGAGKGQADSTQRNQHEGVGLWGSRKTA